MKEQALAANSQKPTSERRPLFIIVFLWYLYIIISIYQYISIVQQQRTNKYPQVYEWL
jgi:hypothetical protein